MVNRHNAITGRCCTFLESLTIRIDDLYYYPSGGVGLPLDDCTDYIVSLSLDWYLYRVVFNRFTLGNVGEFALDAVLPSRSTPDGAGVRCFRRCTGDLYYCPILGLGRCRGGAWAGGWARASSPGFVVRFICRVVVEGSDDDDDD